MMRFLTWLLIVGSLVCLGPFFSVQGAGGPNKSSFRMGLPDAWLVITETGGSHSFAIHVLRWSVARRRGLSMCGILLATPS